MSYLKDQAAQLDDQSLGPWAQQAKAHWKEFLPNKYQGLEESGDLEAALLLAQDKATTMAARLGHQGLNPLEAEELAKNEYLFLEPESEQEKREREYEDLLNRRR